MAQWFYIHDGLSFSSREALKEHEKDCQICAPFVAAQAQADKEFGQRFYANLKAANVLLQPPGDGHEAKQ